MSQWDQVKFKPELKSGNVNKSVPGGKFIGLGKHLVRIEGIEPASTKTGDGYLKITYANSTGQTIMDRLFLKDKEGKASYKYRSLAFALAHEDSTLRYEVFTNSNALIPNNPQNWEGLTGLYVEIEVERGNNGYTVEDDNGTYRLYDVKEKEFYTLAGGIPNEFENYKDAREAAQAQGLYRAWNQVNKFNASEAHVESNEEVLAELLASSKVNGSL